MATMLTATHGRRSVTPETKPISGWVAATVRQITVETPLVKTFWLDLPERMPFLAGQHLELRLTAANGYQAVRSYSIANSPLEAGLAITVQMLENGEVSGYLDSRVHVGDQIELRYPIGYHFVWESTITDPVLLVAGGSGVVPLGSMLRHHQLSQATTSMRLLYSARSYDDVIYKPFLESYDFAQSGRRLDLTLTDHPPVDWHGYSRRIDRAILEEVTGDLDRSKLLVYICGPTPMVEAVANLAVQALGLDPLKVKTERFGPTGQ